MQRINFSLKDGGPNDFYLADTHYTAPKLADSSTAGLMMLLSTFQYQAPYMSPVYSNAASQLGKAAYIQSGAQSFQDKFLQSRERDLRDIARDLGITDGEAAVFLGTAKIVRDKQISLDGPKIHSISTHLTGDQSSGKIMLKWDY